jgi:hypothetical protein
LPLELKFNKEDELFVAHSAVAVFIKDFLNFVDDLFRKVEFC